MLRRRLAAHAALAWFLVGLAGPALAQKAEPARGERYALLVGVRQYDPNELRSLPYSEADAEGLARVFLARGYRPQNVVLMTQKAGAEQLRFLPVAEKIERELELLARDVTGEDSVVVALAGHGVQFQGDRESYFCPADARLADRSTLIPLSRIYATLEQCPAAFKLLLVDACRNDPQSDNSRSRSTARLESVSRPPATEPPGGVAALFSCSPGEKAYEHASLKHGVFFHFVIEGLSGAATDAKSEAVTLPELELYVKRQVHDFVRAEYGERQMPELFGRSRGLVPLVRLDRAMAEYERGKALGDAGQNDPAISALSQALRLKPDLAVAFYERGRIRMRERSYLAAIADFNEAVKNGLNTAAVYNERGQAHREARQVDRSLADHTEAIRLEPTLPDSFAYRAITWNQKRDHARAMTDASHAVRLGPSSAIAYLSRGATYEWLKDDGKALADFDQAIRLDPTFALAFACRANTYNKTGRHDRAMADANEAIRLDPKLAYAYGNRGLAFNKQGQFAQGIHDLNEAIRLEPGNSTYFTLRAWAHESLKDYNRALDDANEAVRLDPTNAWAFVNRASAHKSMGNYARAASDASEAIRLDPTSATAYLYRGAAHSFSNNFDQAYDDYTQAIRLDPRLAQAYMNRSKIIRVRGQDVSGRNAADRARALLLDPKVIP